MQLRQPLPGADIEVGSGVFYATIAIVLASTAIHLWAAARVGLVPDETYYWLWSRVPSFGYFDHPPMVAWMIALGTKIFGNTAFGIRIFFVAVIPLVSAILYWTSRLLFESQEVACLATIWFNASILIGVGGMLATPDTPSVLFWSLAVLALALTWKSGRGAWWLAVGLAAGLGAVSKYTNLFFGLGIVVWLVVSPRQRRWLLSPWPWAGGVVAFLTFLPVIIWNANHHWDSFAKQFGRMVPHAAHPRFFPEFLLSQAGLLNPLVAIFAVMGAIAAFRRTSHEQDRDGMRFLLLLSAPLLAYMALHALHNRVEGNWLAPIYPSLALLGAAATVGLTRGKLLWRLKNAAAPLGLCISVLGLTYLASPRVLLGPKDPSERARGWQALAQEINTLRKAKGANWVATQNYSITGELSFHLPHTVPVRQINNRERYSFEPDIPMTALGQRAILVVRVRRHSKTALEDSSIMQDKIVPEAKGGTQSKFAKLIPIATMARTSGGVTIERFNVFLAIDPVAQ